MKGERADVFVYCLDLLIKILQKYTFFDPLRLEQILVFKTQVLHYFFVFFQLLNRVFIVFFWYLALKILIVLHLKFQCDYFVI